MPDIVGHYTNEKYHQHIIISSGADGIPQIQICGTAGCSRPFEIFRVDKGMLTLSQIPQVKSSFLSVDTFGDWRSLDLVIDSDQSGNVVSLTCSREAFSVVYT